MRAEVQKLKAVMKLPSIPADEKNIYQTAINEIERRIRALENSESGPTAPIATPTPLIGTRAQIKAPSKPASSSNIGPAYQRDQQQPNKATSPTTNGSKPMQAAKHTINAALSPGTKKVVIDWGNGHEEALTEGETRSRFTTALRDLAMSRMVRQERFEQLPEYVTFQRAVTYYRALAHFWGVPPSAQQLGISPLGKAKSAIFEMIQNSN